jgi:hypothetical protein
MGEAQELPLEHSVSKERDLTVFPSDAMREASSDTASIHIVRPWSPLYHVT